MFGDIIKISTKTIIVSKDFSAKCLDDLSPKMHEQMREMKLEHGQLVKFVSPRETQTAIWHREKGPLEMCSCNVEQHYMHPRGFDLSEVDESCREDVTYSWVTPTDLRLMHWIPRPDQAEYSIADIVDLAVVRLATADREYIVVIRCFVSPSISYAEAFEIIRAKCVGREIQIVLDPEPYEEEKMHTKYFDSTYDNYFIVDYGEIVEYCGWENVYTEKECYVEQDELVQPPSRTPGTLLFYDESFYEKKEGDGVKATRYPTPEEASGMDCDELKVRASMIMSRQSSYARVGEETTDVIYYCLPPVSYDYDVHRQHPESVEYYKYSNCSAC